MQRWKIGRKSFSKWERNECDLFLQRLQLATGNWRVCANGIENAIIQRSFRIYHKKTLEWRICEMTQIEMVIEKLPDIGYTIQ